MLREENRREVGTERDEGPGEYREAVTLKSGVQLVGSRNSLLKPPVGAAGDWTAVTEMRACPPRSLFRKPKCSSSCDATCLA